MAPRPIWKGYLKLSLVSCPVALFTAASASEKIALHLINRETGNRLRRQLVDAETGDVVESDEQVRGYEVSRGEHVVLEDDELEAIALESTHTIDIEAFVPRSQVDERYLDTPYYMIPDGDVGAEAFAVIREAMKRKHVAGLARVVLYRRERILMLEPHDQAILATTLRYHYEVRDEGDYVDDIERVALPKEMLDLAEHIINTKAGKFEPKRFEDRYEDALVELIRSKQAGKPPKGPPPKPSNVIDLMDALRRSVGQRPSAAGKEGGSRAKRRGRPAAKGATGAHRKARTRMRKAS
jgi:DNA end-binding protein Ku